MPSPNDFTRLPLASNLRIAGRFEPVHEFCWQRSATQMLTPSLSISTALVDPHVRPSGSFAQPAIGLVRIGPVIGGGHRRRFHQPAPTPGRPTLLPGRRRLRSDVV